MLPAIPAAIMGFFLTVSHKAPPAPRSPPPIPPAWRASRAPPSREVALGAGPPSASGVMAAQPVAVLGAKVAIASGVIAAQGEASKAVRPPVLANSAPVSPAPSSPANSPAPPRPADQLPVPAAPAPPIPPYIAGNAPIAKAPRVGIAKYGAASTRVEPKPFADSTNGSKNPLPPFSFCVVA